MSVFQAHDLHSSDVEEELLGNVLMFPDVARLACKLLGPQDFFDPRARSVFEVVKSQNGQTSPGLVCAELAGKIQTPGVYLSTVIEQATVPSLSEQLIRKVRQYRYRREFTRLMDSVSPQDTNHQQVLREAAELANRLSLDLAHTDDLSSGLAHDLERWELGQNYGIPSPWEPLDEKLGSFRPGQLVVVAGRPGTGKSSVLLNVALKAAQEHFRTVFFTLEMTPAECRHRILSWRSGLPLSRWYQGGPPSAEEMQSVTVAAGELAELKNWLAIEQEGSMTVQTLSERLAGLDVDMVVVDYLQLLKGSGVNPKESLYERVTNISRELKLLAKDHNCVVIAGAQLNRQNESRTDRRPMLSDLRDSGAIEQDADVVMFTIREHASDVSKDPRKAELVVAKNRQGPLGTVPMTFDTRTTEFRIDLTELLTGTREV